MFDIGGWEFLVIIVLGIVIIGPKELPGAIRNVTMWVRKARGLAREFQGGLDEIVRESELDKLKDDLDPTGTMNTLTADVENEIGEGFDYDQGDWLSDHMDDEDDDDGEETSIADDALDDALDDTLKETPEDSAVADEADTTTRS